nr:immunoglobulin heavy chain junction region [Mus musculus]
CARYYYGSGDW